MDTASKPTPNLAEWRQKAEERLRAAPDGGAPDSPETHDLRLYQLELEMQCEALAEQNAALEQERQAIRARFRTLQDIHGAINATVQAVLRIREEPVLLQKVCTIAADFGSFPLAWIGMEQPGTPVLRVAAAAGPGVGYLEGLEVCTDPGRPEGQGPIGRAMRQGRPAVVEDFRNDPVAGSWSPWAAQFGLRTCAALPIRRSGRVVGALAVYSDRPGFFELDPLTLLDRISESLTFALDAYDREAALKASEEKFSRIFRLSPDAIDLTDLETGVIHECNDSFTRLYGHSRGMTIGRSTLPGDLGIWLSDADREQYVARLKADGEVIEAEYPLRRSDGSQFTGLLSSALLELGGRPYNLSIIRDVSERKRAERDLLEERTFTRAMLDNLTEGVAACDEQGNLKLFNRTLLEWHGLGPSQALPERLEVRQELFESDGATPLGGQSSPLERAFSGEILHGAGMAMRVGTELRQVLVNAGPILAGDGSRLGAVAVLHDITRQRQMDQLVRKISVAVEQSPVTIVITDPSGLIEYVNPKFTELTGYTPQEVLGQNPRVLKSGTMPAEVYADLWRTITSGAIWKGELRNRKKNGDLFWESATIAPIRDGAGAVTSFVAVKEDVTLRKQTEDQLLQLNDGLEEAIERRTALLELANSELDAFSYSVSHDLRAPLRGIDGFSQALLEECGDQLNETARHYLRRVRAGTQRMGQLIDDLLKLSRVSRGALNRQRLDLSGMARLLVEEMRQGEPGRSLEVQLEPGLVANGDQGLVRSALANLLGNAWKYSAKVPLARIELFHEVQPDGSVAFCVRDNGAGFDMAYASKLFSAFQRLHSAEDFEGSGIGLAIVRRIIRRHGGQVWAKALVGQGASFYFTLPDAP